MHLSLNWLKEFVPVSGKPEVLADVLTRSGTEVTAVRRLDTDVSKIIVGEVKTLVQHPHADRLKIAKVNVGAGSLWEIVCGAPNITAGQKVAVAPIGARLPNGTVIAERRLRGIASQGMICSEAELGLGGDGSGILVLDPETPAGQSLKTALGLPEVVFDLDLTPNRGDCFSILGMAREVAASTGTKVKAPGLRQPKGDLKSTMTARLSDTAACPFFAMIEIRGVTIGPSPAAIRNRLRAMGIRPINNVVDISNYVMLELGQPTHAFDARAITGKRLVIRRARAKEKLTTLDGKDRVLTPDVTIIADSRRALDVAGVMGGHYSEITAKTRDVLLTAGYFQSKGVRANRRALQMTSEASTRFERGVDPALVEASLLHAAALIVEHAAAKRVHRLVRVGSLPKSAAPIIIDPVRVTKLLGVAVTPKRATTLLTSLGFSIDPHGAFLKVGVPSWRHDISTEADVVEEIGRLIDYNTMRPTLPSGAFAPAAPPPIARVRDEIRNILLTAGCSEVILSAFTNAEQSDQFGVTVRDLVRVANPLNSEQTFLRRSLIPGLVMAAARNSVSRPDVRLFETGIVFSPAPKGKGPLESEKVAWVIVGKNAERHVRGILDVLVSRLGLPALHIRQRGREAFFVSGKQVVARLESFAPTLRAALKIREHVAAIVLDLEAFTAALPKDRQFTPPSEFPSVERDLAFWVPAGVSYAQIERAVSGVSPLLQAVHLVDVFEKEQRRSMTVRLTFQAPDRTLTNEEVDRLVAKVTTTLSGTLQLEFRS
jgi:phenylalanyl-tRNA synthetase beta chain